jgi:hypothetical protein
MNVMPACISSAATDPKGETLAYQLPVQLDRTSSNVVVFEVDEQDVPRSDDLQMASDDGSRTAATARRTFEETLNELKPSLHKVVEMLKDLAPDEASVDFGLKIGGEYGAIIAKGSAEVNFAIHMTWKTGER